MSIPVTNVAGIGPKMADLLAENGIKSVADLIQAGVEKLTLIPGISQLKAQAFIDAAKELQDDAGMSLKPVAAQSDTRVTKVSQKQVSVESAAGKDKKKDKKDKKKDKKNKERKKKKESKKDRKKTKARNRKNRKNKKKKK